MVKFRGVSAALTAIAQVFQNPGVFLKITFCWTLVFVTVALAQLVYLTSTTAGNFAESIKALGSISNLRNGIALDYAPSVLSSLATTILWTRFVVSGERPDGWIKIPKGSARYFGRSLILGFGAILGVIPGLVAARVAAEHVQARFTPFIGPLVIGLDVLVVIYVCMRLWLVFPAIAIGDSTIDFAESFRLMKGSVFQLFLGIVITTFALVVAIILCAILTIVVPQTVPFFLMTQFLSSLTVLASTAVSAGLTAKAYKVLVLEAQAK
jgi:hypothetical protein